MTTYAKISSGHIENPFVAEDRTALAECAHPDWFLSQGGIDLWVEVPDIDSNGDKIMHGAVDNHDGSFTNPPKPQLPSVARAITKSEFQQLLADSNNDLTAALEAWPMTNVEDAA